MQHDAASVEGLPPYVKDDLKSPLVQEKWADIEATLPPYEAPKTRAKRRLFGRKDWVRIVTVVFAVFLCIIVPAVVVGVVFGLRAPSSSSSSDPATTLAVPDSTSTQPMSDPIYTATDQDGNPLFGGAGASTIAPPSETRPSTFQAAPSPPSQITPAVPSAAANEAVTALDNARF